MPDWVLDTVVLRALTFGHPTGIDILLTSLGGGPLQLPSEVYDRDEDALPPGVSDRSLSELARGIRFARLRSGEARGPDTERVRVWIECARQLPPHFDRGSLVIEYLTLPELRSRNQLMRARGIGRGEAAALIVAQRVGARPVFLSSDAEACVVADSLAIPYLTLVDVLHRWIETADPTHDEVSRLVDGLASARFGLNAGTISDLHRLVHLRSDRG
jgi:hypothetical protein